MKTQVIKLDPQFPDLNEIRNCAKIIQQGGLVVFPTETVYGIAANYVNPQAMQRLREAKKRSENKHFSVIISQPSLISNYTNMTDPLLFKLIGAYWPGPLTIVVPAKKEGQTVGVRMPDHEIAIRLTQSCPFPVAAPSANFENNPPPRTCEEALRDLNGLVDIAIDGGPARIGKGSTVVDITDGKIKILRDGAIPAAEIEKTAKRKNILFVCTGNSCRSVMGEYLLRNLLKGRDDVDIRSAGTGVFLQSSASQETISVLREEGIDASRHIAQPINNLLLKKADLIFALTRTHRQQILERAPSVEQRVYLLGEFASSPSSFQTDLDIPDPIGGTHEEYERCKAVIKNTVMKIKELV